MADSFVVHDDAGRIGVKSLFDISMDKLRRNIHLLWETNDTPKHILLPLVTLVHNPEQLGAIENSSPHLKGELGVFWLRIIKKNIFGWENMLFKDRLHSDGRPWTEEEVIKHATYRTYRNCVKKMKQQDAAAFAQLRQAVGEASAVQKDKETRVIEKLPPGYLPGPKRRAGQGYDGTSRASQTGELRFGGGSRTKTTTGHGVMTKIRREMKEARFARKGGALSTPTHLLKQKAAFLPQGIDKRFDMPQPAAKRPNIVRLTARPTTTIIGPMKKMSGQAASLVSRPLSASPAKPASQSQKRPRPMDDSDFDVQGVLHRVAPSPLQDRSSPPRPRIPGQRKKAPPTVLMPAKRRKPA